MHDRRATGMFWSIVSKAAERSRRQGQEIRGIRHSWSLSKVDLLRKGDTVDCLRMGQNLAFRLFVRPSVMLCLRPFMS